MTFARVENNPDRDAAALGVIERRENNRVCERVRCQVD